MNRGYLAVGAAVVLAAAIGLLVMLRTDAAPTEDHRAADPPAVQNASGTAPGKARNIRNAPPTVPPAGSGTTEHTAGTVRIRDHRSGDQSQVEPPPPTQPPDGRKVAPKLTGDLAQQIRPLLEQCARSIPPSARSNKSRVEGQILISIKDQQATVTSATFQLRDVAEPAQDEVKQCLARQAVGLRAPAGQEADVEAYSISLSMALP